MIPNPATGEKAIVDLSRVCGDDPSKFGSVARINEFVPRMRG